MLSFYQSFKESVEELPMKPIAAILVLIALAPLSVTAFAHGKSSALEFDQLATPANSEMLFGSGNDNGAFTTHRRKGVEVALRVKKRFPTPANTFFSNGDGTYSVPKGFACPGFSFAPNCFATPFWSFEWSVNVDYDGSTNKHLSDYTYELGMDSDPGRRTKFTRFDPITPLPPVVPLFDHAIGNNSSTNPGSTADNPTTYQTLLDDNNVAQNSWNYEFFNNLGTSLAAFDPDVDGNYIIYLRVMKKQGYGKRKIVAQSFIQVLVGNASPVKWVRLPRPKK